MGKFNIVKKEIEGVFTVEPAVFGDYENEVGGIDPIKVITLKKVNADDGKGSNVVARNVTGKYVYENRKAFEFEVRL